METAVQLGLSHNPGKSAKGTTPHATPPRRALPAAKMVFFVFVFWFLGLENANLLWAWLCGETGPVLKHLCTALQPRIHSLWRPKIEVNLTSVEAACTRSIQTTAPQLHIQLTKKPMVQSRGVCELGSMWCKVSVTSIPTITSARPVKEKIINEVIRVMWHRQSPMSQQWRTDLWTGKATDEGMVQKKCRKTWLAFECILSGVDGRGRKECEDIHHGHVIKLFDTLPSSAGGKKWPENLPVVVKGNSA